MPALINRNPENVRTFFKGLSEYYKIPLNNSWSLSLWKKIHKDINIKSSGVLRTWISQNRIPKHALASLLNLDIPDNLKFFCGNRKKKTLHQDQNQTPEEKAAFEFYSCYFPALSMICPHCKKRHPFPTKAIRKSKALLLSAITGEKGACSCEYCKSTFCFKLNTLVMTSKTYDFNDLEENSKS